MVKYGTMEKKDPLSVDDLLLCADFFFSPPRKTSVALDGETVTTIAAAKPANAGAQTSERALLWRLGLLNGRERTLGEGWQTYST